MAPDPLKRSRQRQGPSLAFHTIGVQGYFSSVQPPFRNYWIRPCVVVQINYVSQTSVEVLLEVEFFG